MRVSLSLKLAIRNRISPAILRSASGMFYYTQSPAANDFLPLRRPKWRGRNRAPRSCLPSAWWWWKGDDCCYDYLNNRRVTLRELFLLAHELEAK